MQMKLAFIGDNTLADVEADSAFAREHGFEAIEYNFWGTFRDLTPDTVHAMRKIHEKHGVRASMLGLWGFNHISPDKTVREEAHAMLTRAIEYAKILGADVLVTGAGEMPNEPVGTKVREFARVFPPMLEKIEKAGLKASFYPIHGASFIDSLQTFERLLEDVPGVRLKFDPANWDAHGDDYLEIARRYGHKIGYIHIKEHLNYNDSKAVSQPAAGMGSIEWGKVFAFLYEHNYSGWLSIEPHGPIWSKGEMRKKMLLLTQRYIGQFLI